MSSPVQQTGADGFRFAELVAATNFSFLRGASHPFEMVAQAAGLGLSGIGICDRNSLSGVVRAYSAWKDIRGDYPGFPTDLPISLSILKTAPHMGA